MAHNSRIAKNAAVVDPEASNGLRNTTPPPRPAVVTGHEPGEEFPALRPWVIGASIGLALLLIVLAALFSVSNGLSHAPGDSNGREVATSHGHSGAERQAEEITVANEDRLEDESGTDTVVQQPSGNSGESESSGSQQRDAADPAPNADHDITPLDSSMTQKEPTAHEFFSIPHRAAESGPQSAIDGSKEHFFGVRTEGSRLAFVIDMSGSMVGPRFEAARQELIESLMALKDHQEFFVVFFNDSHLPQAQSRMLNPSPRNKRMISRWINRIGPNGGTDPRSAIDRALSHRPDTIYLLSDGDFQIDVAGHVRQANHDGAAAIHSISFDRDAVTLRTIASQNGGSYRHVQFGN